MSLESMRKIKGYGVGERAVIGKLRRIKRKDAGMIDTIEGIAFSCDKLDVSEMSLLAGAASGIVTVGEKNDPIATVARMLDIPALFISDEDAEYLKDGERALLYPDRNTLFIAPQIKALDEFTSKVKSNDKEYEDSAADLIECREYFSDKTDIFAIKADSEFYTEEKAFNFYRDVAEKIGLLKLIIIIDISKFERGSLREMISGIIRAGTYTKILPTILVKSVNEYESVLHIIKTSVNDLKRANREIPTKIYSGVIIENPNQVMCIDAYSRMSELVVINATDLVKSVPEEEKAIVLERYFEIIYERMPDRVKDVIFVGDKTLLEKSAGRVIREEGKGRKSYFMEDKDNKNK